MSRRPNPMPMTPPPGFAIPEKIERQRRPHRTKHAIAALIYGAILGLIVWAFVAWLDWTPGPTAYVIGATLAYFFGLRAENRRRA